MKTACLISFVVVLTQSIILSPAWAGWTTTALHPSGNYVSSAAHAVTAGQIGGNAFIPSGPSDTANG